MARNTKFVKGNKAAKGKGPKQTPEGKPRPGRPPNAAVESIRDYFRTFKREDLGNKTMREAALDALARLLKANDPKAIKEVLDRTDPVKQEIGMSGGLTFEIVYPDGGKGDDSDEDD